MTSQRSKFSLAIAGAGFLGFAVLASGVWHKKLPMGGLTQVGRTASLTFEDGTKLELGETEQNQDILRRRRMGGWHGREFRQVFILPDGQEMEVVNNRPGFTENSNELSTGDELILAAYNSRFKRSDKSTLEGDDKVSLAALQVDDKTQEAADRLDAKDRVTTNVIDFKDRVVRDDKDVKDHVEQPIFALNDPAAGTLFDNNDHNDWLSMTDPGGIWFNLHTGGGFMNPGGLGGNPGPGGGGITTPPIGTAVPEPSALVWMGSAGAVGAAGIAWKRRLA